MLWGSSRGKKNSGCQEWWLSSGFSSVVELWWLKPGALGSISSDCKLLTFLYFHLITSKHVFTSSWGKAFRLREIALSWWREFSGWSLLTFWQHILSGCWVWDWSFQHHLYRIKGAGCCLVVVPQWYSTGFNSQQLSPFYFPLFCLITCVRFNYYVLTSEMIIIMGRTWASSKLLIYYFVIAHSRICHCQLFKPNLINK